MKKTEIIFIIGHGRSGTTLIDMFLTQQFDAVSVGQIINLEALITSSQTKLCTCGQTINDCQRWGEILRRVSFDGAFKSNPFFASGKRFRQLGVAFSKCLGSRKLVNQTHIDHQISFINAVTDVAGANLIVDSSKNLNRFDALCAIDTPDFDVKAVYVKRSMEGVVSSKQKAKSARVSSSLLAALSWSFQNLISAIYFKKFEGKKIFIEFEDFTVKPEFYFQRIRQELNLELNGQYTSILEPPAMHMIAGNSISRQSQILIERSSKPHRVDWWTMLIDFIIAKPTNIVVAKLCKQHLC